MNGIVNAVPTTANFPSLNILYHLLLMHPGMSIENATVSIQNNHLLERSSWNHSTYFIPQAGDTNTSRSVREFLALLEWDLIAKRNSDASRGSIIMQREEIIDWLTWFNIDSLWSSLQNSVSTCQSSKLINITYTKWSCDHVNRSPLTASGKMCVTVCKQ